MMLLYSEIDRSRFKELYVLNFIHKKLHSRPCVYKEASLSSCPMFCLYQNKGQLKDVINMDTSFHQVWIIFLNTALQTYENITEVTI
jgi:hypothetical protein